MNPNLTILAVDDDEGHALLVHESLREAGLTNHIEHFGDGQAALNFFFAPGTGRSIERGQTYLILLDIRMPKVDGFEVLRRLKADDQLCKLPVIMLTTSDDAQGIDRCYALGCNAYVQKPVDYDRFAETVRRIGRFTDVLMAPATFNS